MRDSCTNQELEEINKHPIMKFLNEHSPDRNMIAVAMDVLKTERKIRMFYDEYVSFLVSAHAMTKEDAQRVARSNIGYIKGYFSQTVWDRWKAALPEAVHPIFGENPPASAAEAFRMGVERGMQSGRPELDKSS